MTLVAPLLLASGPGRYEAVLHSCDSAHSWRLYSVAPLGKDMTFKVIAIDSTRIRTHRYGTGNATIGMADLPSWEGGVLLPVGAGK